MRFGLTGVEFRNVSGVQHFRAGVEQGPGF